MIYYGFFTIFNEWYRGCRSFKEAAEHEENPNGEVWGQCPIFGIWHILTEVKKKLPKGMFKKIQKGGAK